MPVSDNRIDDFIARWKRVFGEELTKDQARIEAERVLHLYRRLLRFRRDNRDVGDVAAPATQPAEAQAVAPRRVARNELEAA